MKKLVLIDGHSILNRAFYGVPDLTNSEGLHTNAVYGFLNIMLRILDEEKPDYLTVAFDVKEKTFRHKMFTEYKGTRKPMPEELHMQVPLIQDVLKAMNIRVVTLPGFEADDILGTLSKKAEKEGLTVSIVSGDRDLLQLATDNIKIRIPKTKKGVTEIEDYNTAQVIEAYGVTPLEFIDVKALMGDTSDNIPGVPSIGEKTAGQIIATYHSIENAYEHIDEITPPRAKTNLFDFYEQAKLSKVLATIEINAPIDNDFEHAKLDNMFNPDSFKLFKRFEFKSLLTRFDDTKNTLNTEDVDKTFVTVEDFNKVEELFASLSTKSAGIYLATDDYKNLEGVAVSTGDVTYFIPVFGLVSQSYLCDKVLNYIDNLDKNYCTFINAKEQLRMLGVEYSDKVYDLAIMAYLINPLKDTYLYDDISRDYMGLLLKSRTDLMGKLSFSDSFAPTLMFDSDNKCDMATLTASYNAYVARNAYDRLKNVLIEQGMYKLFTDIEMPLVYALIEMENNGVRIDKGSLITFGQALKVRIDELTKDIYELAGEEFNINSPKQLGEILFEKLGLKGGKKTKTGYSTSADVLEKLAYDNPIVSKILEYRQLTKLNSTYAEGLVNYIGSDGRIHGIFNQTITATGRISSTEPNLQNIPIRTELGSKIREVFVPEEGYVFLDSDYSQIELRILAHMSEDERLITAYNSSEDIHRITASQVFNTPLEQVTKAQRSNAKAVNFGIVYGISSFGLSQDLSISRKEAASYIDKYFETYPGVKLFLDKLVDEAKHSGYSLTMFGRRRPIPELTSSNFMQKQFGERVAMNAPIQGTAADIMKIAMISVFKELKKNNLKSRLILQVHDELLVETAPDEIDVVKDIIETSMKSAASLSVSLVVDTNEGKNWLEAH